MAVPNKLLASTPSPTIEDLVRELVDEPDKWLDTENAQLGGEKPRNLAGTAKEPVLATCWKPSNTGRFRDTLPVPPIFTAALFLFYDQLAIECPRAGSLSIAKRRRSSIANGCSSFLGKVAGRLVAGGTAGSPRNKQGVA